jgi:hypothetical protein
MHEGICKGSTQPMLAFELGTGTLFRFVWGMKRVSAVNVEYRTKYVQVIKEVLAMTYDASAAGVATCWRPPLCY